MTPRARVLLVVAALVISGALVGAGTMLWHHRAPGVARAAAPAPCLVPGEPDGTAEGLRLLEGPSASSAVASALAASRCFSHPASPNGAGLVVSTVGADGDKRCVVMVAADEPARLQAALPPREASPMPVRGAFIGDRQIAWAARLAWVREKGGSPVQCFDLTTGEVVWSLVATAAYDAGHVDRIAWGGQDGGGVLAVEAQAATSSGWVRQVIVLDLDAGSPRVLRTFATDSGERSVWPGLALSPDGRRVFFQDGDTLCEAELPQGPVRIVGSCTTAASAALPSPDGRYWAEVDMGTRESLLCGMRILSVGGMSGHAGTGPVALEGTYEPFSVKWIDGTDMLLSAVAPSEAARGELVVSTPDGKVRRVGPNGGTAPFNHGFWVLRGGKGAWRLSRMRTDTWTEEPLVLE